MAEIQKTSETGDTTARFIEFVMMQAQNASLFLGLNPNPPPGAPEVNLDLARLFIDQLAMIQEKTRGNLSNEEAGILRNALANLQMAFVEVSQKHRAPGGVPAAPAPAADVPKASDPAQPKTPAAPEAEIDSRKRFSKSYGS